LPRSAAKPDVVADGAQHAHHLVVEIFAVQHAAFRFALGKYLRDLLVHARAAPIVTSVIMFL
jgi:hypothetical protein